jgi:branched-chain amino acid transport system permease protein
MQQFLNVTLTGLAQGAVYAAVALALVLIWRSTRVVNFAQGAMAMFTTYIALALVEAGQSYWIALLAALVSGLLLGAGVERLVVRPS